MIVQLDKLAEAGERFRGTLAPESMELVGDEGIACRGDLEYDLTLSLSGTELSYRGQIELAVAFRCCRCAEFFDARVRESSLEGLKAVPETANSADLTPELREAMILAFPNYPVCSANCRGLCSQCGVNLNESGCDCRPPTDDRWGALDQISVE